MFTFTGNNINGFRYAKITGPKKVNLDDFIGEVVYSDLIQTGTIETSNSKVNRLSLNALWGQKGNFLGIQSNGENLDN